MSARGAHVLQFFEDNWSEDDIMHPEGEEPGNCPFFNHIFDSFWEPGTYVFIPSETGEGYAYIEVGHHYSEDERCYRPIVDIPLPPTNVI